MLRLFIIGHFHERESSRPPGFPVHGHVNARNLTERSKEVPHIAFGRLKTQIANKQILHVFLAIGSRFSIHHIRNSR